MNILEQLRGEMLLSTRTGYQDWSSQYQSFADTWGSQSLPEALTSYGDRVLRGYLANSAVFGLMSTRTSFFSEAKFKWRRLADKRIWGDTSLEVLELPWPNGSTSDLLMRMLQDADFAGTAYVRRTDDGFLERLRPDWVKVVSDYDPFGRLIVVGIMYQPGGQGAYVEYDSEDVAIWAPNPDPSSHFRGVSWVAASLPEIRNDESMRQHILSFFRHAATPNMIYKYGKKLKPEDREELQNLLDARTSGSENAGRTMILEDGAEAQVVGASFEAMAFTDLSQDQRGRLAHAAGIPSVLAGLTQGRTNFGNDYTPAVRFLADITMRPLWRSACSTLAQFVTVPAGSELWYDTTDVAALQSGEQEAAGVVQTQIAAVGSARQGGATYESAVLAVSANDITLLIPDPVMVSVQLQAQKAAAAPAEPPAEMAADDPKNPESPADVAQEQPARSAVELHVHVESPETVVNVDPPDVTVNMPTAPAATRSVRTVERDGNGDITRIVDEEG